MTKKSSESQTYESMLQRVEGIIGEVSGDSVSLDGMLERVEEAYGLISKMRHRLDDSKAKVEALREQFETQLEK